MKNNITELVFILDRSGSMAGLGGDLPGRALRHWRGGFAFISLLLINAGCSVTGNSLVYQKKLDMPFRVLYDVVSKFAAFDAFDCRKGVCDAF